MTSKNAAEPDATGTGTSNSPLSRKESTGQPGSPPETVPGQQGQVPEDRSSVRQETRQRLLVLDIEKKLGLLLIFVFLAVTVALAFLNIPAAYELPFILPFMNTFFLGLIPLFIAYLALRISARSGSASVFLMGCGILIFGLGSIAAGWVNPLPDGPNMTVTIHNTCAFFGSVLILAGAVLRRPDLKFGRHNGSARTIATAYAALGVGVALFSFATVQGMIPPFFVPGTGPTVLRQMVLENAVVFFTLSAVLFMVAYRKERSDFSFWFSIALALIATGLLAVYFQPSVGSLIGWVGRTAQYLGCVFALYAVLLARRISMAKGLPLDEVMTNFFADAEENYKLLVNTATDAVVTIDENNRVILWNPAAERIFGYQHDEMMGSRFSELLIDDQDFADFKKEEQYIPGRALTMQAPDPVEITGKRKDGELFPVELTMSRRLQEGRSIRTCILRDITERRKTEDVLKQAHDTLEKQVSERTAQLTDANRQLLAEVAEREKTEILLRENQENLQAFFNATADPVVLLAADGTILAANAITSEAFHAPVDAVIGRNAYELLLPEIAQRRKMWVDSVVMTGKPAVNYDDRAGRTLEHHLYPVFDNDNTVRAIAIYAKDITERKKAEESLRESERRYRELVENLNDVVFTLDDNGIITYMSPVGEANYGYTPAGLLGKPFTEVVFDDDIPPLVKRFGEFSPETIEPLEWRLKHKDGSLSWVRTSTRRVAGADETGGFLGILSDISREKQAEKALQESEARYHLLFNRGREAVAVHKMGKDGQPTHFIQVNDVACERLGYTREEMLNLSPQDIDAPDRAGQMPAIIEKLQKNNYVLFETEHVAKDGHRIPVEVSTVLFQLDDDQATLSVARDITERKRAEHALRQSEGHYRELADSISDVFFAMDFELRYTHWNKASENLTGIASSQAIGKSISEVFPDTPEIRNTTEIYRNVLKTRQPRIFESAFMTGDQTLWLEIHVYPSSRGISVFTRDITKRKHAEAALQSAQEKYTKAFLSSPDAIMISDMETGRFIEMNDATSRIYGYSRGEMIGKSALELGIWVRKEDRDAFIDKVRTEGHVERYETTERKKSGDLIAVSISADTITLGDKIHLLSTVRDVSRRKHYEDVLMLSNRIFSIANHHQQIAPMLDEVVHAIREYTGCDSVGIRLVDAEGNIPYTAYNGFAASFYDRESPLNILKDECMCIYVIRGDANPDLPVITPKGSFWCNGTTKFLAGVSDEEKGKTRNVCNQVGYESVALIAIKRGEKILGLIHLADHREGMVPIGKVEVLEDISQALGSAIQRLLAETDTRQSLSEKEVLLREIHHRVKNNLTSIISLIDLQIVSLTDPGQIYLLKDLETRIRSMALVHESLYLSQDLNRINITIYVENLARHLLQVYGKAMEIRYRFDTGDITLPIETAIPVGLVMTEIVTNSLKYAFPETFSCTAQRGEPCTITLSMAHEDNNYRLMIADNGIGIPREIDFATTQSLGLYLTRFIVKHQLRGSIDISTGNGTAFTIRFPEVVRKERHAQEET